MHRTSLPEWPRLMPVETAAAYLGVSVGTFRKLGIAVRSVGRRVLFDRRDLDLYADQLGDQPLPPEDRAKAAADTERRFLERRRRA